MKIAFIVLLLLQLQVPLAQIVNDFGEFLTNFSASCSNNYIQTYTITFTNTFSNIPQVILSPSKYDLSPGQTEFIIQIQTITTTSFGIKIQCTKSGGIYSGNIKWAAFDDNRIEVINSFSVNMNGQTTKTLTFPHSNSNFIQGFIALINFGFSSTLEFTASITSITSTEVIVEIVSTNTNILSVGFQIVLGTADVFTISSVLDTGYLYQTTTFYTGPTITIPTQSKGLIFYQGLSYTYTSQGPRLKYLLTETSTTFQYSIQTWYYCRLNYVKFTHFIINRKILQPMVLKKMRVSEIFSNNLDSHPIKLYITETNSIFTAGTNTQYIDKTKQTLTIVVSFQCQSNKKITGYLMRSTSQNQAISQNCYGAMNFIEYYLTFYQQDQIFQNLQITISSTEVAVSEIIYNLVATTYTLLTLSISNQ